MQIYDLITQFTSAIIFASVSALGGLLASWIAERRRRARKKAEAEIERIVEAVQQPPEEVHTTAANFIGKPAFQRSRSAKKFHSEQSAQAEPEGSPTEFETDSVSALITGYHEQALDQARVQFWFSVVAATAGFIWILYAAGEIRPDNAATALKTLPGVVMDAVAFLFFRQASETRQRATDLYDRLRTDKQTTASVELVSSIEDERVRSAVKAQIALHMAGLSPNPIDLTNFLSSRPLETRDLNEARAPDTQPLHARK